MLWRQSHQWRRSGHGNSLPSIRLGWATSAELTLTQLTVLGTLEVKLVDTAERPELKSRRLKLALNPGVVLASLDELLG
jgi:hypothetical protein